MNPAPDIVAAPVAIHGSDDAVNDEAASLTERLAGTARSLLNNPVLPSEFDLFAFDKRTKSKSEFVNSNPVPFARAWKGFHSLHSIKAL